MQQLQYSDLCLEWCQQWYEVKLVISWFFEFQVWTGIPVSIIIFTIYGFVCKQHKYFYPFLIISVSFNVFLDLITCHALGSSIDSLPTYVYYSSRILHLQLRNAKNDHRFVVINAVLILSNKFSVPFKHGAFGEYCHYCGWKRGVGLLLVSYYSLLASSGNSQMSSILWIWLETWPSFCFNCRRTDKFGTKSLWKRCS